MANYDDVYSRITSRTTTNPYKNVPEKMSMATQQALEGKILANSASGLSGARERIRRDFAGSGLGGSAAEKQLMADADLKASAMGQRGISDLRTKVDLDNLDRQMRMAQLRAEWANAGRRMDQADDATLMAIGQARQGQNNWEKQFGLQEDMANFDMDRSKLRDELAWEQFNEGKRRYNQEWGNQMEAQERTWGYQDEEKKFNDLIREKYMVEKYGPNWRQILGTGDQLPIGRY